MAEVLVFVIFIGTGTFLLSEQFPDVAPTGVPNPTQIAQVAQNPLFVKSACGPNDWSCGLVNFFVNIGNGLVVASLMFVSISVLFISLLTFQIPALQANPFTQLVNAVISIPIIVVLGLVIFRGIKSIIPTVGGDMD